MNVLEIKLIKPTTKKLQLVKLIKDCTGIGLKESKEICDNLHAFPDKKQQIKIKENNNVNYKNKFIEGISEIDGEFSFTGDKKWNRNIKLTQLGI